MHVRKNSRLIFILTILFLIGMDSAMTDSPDAPLMSEEQIRACQQGNMDVLASYLGPDNPVIMVCEYKAEWEPPTSKSSKGALTTYATVVRSVDDGFPVGTKIKWISYLEGSISQQMLEQCLSKEGRLSYIINPWKKQREEEWDIVHAQDDIPEVSYSFNFLIAYPYYYNNLRAMLDIPIQPVTSPRVATQTDIDNEHDNFLRGTARQLRQNDIVLAVVIYKTVETTQETIFYARVIQSLRGDIPVEALVQWRGAANNLPVGGSPKTELYSSCNLSYVLATSKEVEKLLGTPEDFIPADSIYGLASYNLGNDVSFFPMTESNSGRAMKKLLRIEPAKITEESEAARFQPESGE